MFEQNSFRPLAFITGASSGLGAAFATRLGRDGYDLVLVARRRERLNLLAQQIQQDHSISVSVITANLTQSRDLRAVEQRIIKAPALTLLVNNAGFGGYMPFVALDPGLAEELILLQVLALTRLTRAALPEMIARGRGTVINVSSRLAFSASIPSPPLPKRATYAGAKAYINTFTQILANELDGTGVSIQALCPGVINTEFHQQVGIDPSAYPASLVMAPEDVVQASLAGLERGEVICIPALDDPGVLREVEESQRQLFEQSRSGTLASRYQS